MGHAVQRSDSSTLAITKSINRNLVNPHRMMTKDLPRSQGVLMMWTRFRSWPRPSARLAHTAGAMSAGNSQRGCEEHDSQVSGQNTMLRKWYHNLRRLRSIWADSMSNVGVQMRGKMYLSAKIFLQAHGT